MRTSTTGIRRTVLAIAVGIIVAANVLPASANHSCSHLGAGQWSCTVTGRDVNIYVPSSYSGTTAVPLVVDMHGYTSSNTSQQGYSGWDDFAATENLIVAYPQGESNSWNAQGQCCGSSNEDDVTFIRNVVAHIQSAANIDGNRIYATGLSNGGSMTHTLACEAADLFAGAAAVSYGLSGASTFSGIVSNCQSTMTEGIPVIHFHGTADGTVDYETGILDSLGAEDSLEAWRQIQSASSSFITENLSSNTSCKTHSNGRDGVQVSMCTVTGGGHLLYPDVAGAGIPTFAWNFFERNPEGGGGGGPTAIFTENFDTGLGTFTATGNVYTGSYGVRMRGGDNDGVIRSPMIDTTGFNNIELVFSRNTEGLDSFEYGYAEVSVNGGSTFTVVEQTRETTRVRKTFPLGSGAAGQTDLVLRFRVGATSFYELYEVDDVVIQGTPA